MRPTHRPAGAINRLKGWPGETYGKRRPSQPAGTASSDPGMLSTVISSLHESGFTGPPTDTPKHQPISCSLASIRTAGGAIVTDVS